MYLDYEAPIWEFYRYFYCWITNPAGDDMSIINFYAWQVEKGSFVYLNTFNTEFFKHLLCWYLFLLNQYSLFVQH